MSPLNIGLLVVLCMVQIGSGSAANYGRQQRQIGGWELGPWGPQRTTRRNPWRPIRPTKTPNPGDNDNDDDWSSNNPWNPQRTTRRNPWRPIRPTKTPNPGDNDNDDDWSSNNPWGPQKTTRRNPWRPIRPTKPNPGDNDNGNGVGCGVQSPNFQPSLGNQRVINGREAKPHSWPWVVGLISSSLRGKFMCGGSLLRVKENVEESDIVLTAAHCVSQMSGNRPVSPSTLSIAAGRHRHNVPGQYNQVQRVSAVRPHPSFTMTSGGAGNDIAVIKLASPIKFTDAVRPVCLPQQGAAIPVGQTCVAAGWGRNDSYNQWISAEALNQVVVPVHSAETCAKGWPDVYKQESMICAGSIEGDSGVCNGDSGSMMVCKDGDRWVQQGVVSFGVSGFCLEADKPDVYARVASYVDWIKQQIQQLSSIAAEKI